MALVIHGTIKSTCTQRVVLTLLEKGVQPFGQVPVLVDGDLTLFESRAIARYLSLKFADQGTNLVGKNLREKGLINVWLEVESQEYNPQVQTIAVQKIFLPAKGGSTDEGKVADAVEKLKHVLDVYEAHLGKQEYLTGAEFSLADLVHIPYGNLLWPAGHADLITSRPNVKKWWERITSRPSWQTLSTDLVPNDKLSLKG
eukprot:jgi/Mesen1/2355/ME000156S01497